jgi:hypothetical protein
MILSMLRMSHLGVVYSAQEIQEESADAFQRVVEMISSTCGGRLQSGDYFKTRETRRNS